MKKLILKITFLLLTNTIIKAQNIDPIIDFNSYCDTNFSYDSGEIFVLFDTMQNIYKTCDKLTINQNNIIVYPNPATDVINIYIPKNETINTIKIYDINSKCLLTQKQYNSPIDISMLQQGLYVLIINTDKETKNYKIIKH